MEPILVGKAVTTPDGGPVHLLPKYGNRHGLVAGATGTGKTVTLMTLAEGFSRIGVPVFLADVKGDVAGLAVPGSSNEKLQARIGQIGIPDWAPAASPVVFWDLFGKLGHPVRTTVSEMGPTLLSRILELNDTQAGVVDIAFKLADDRGLLLLDLDDLRALLNLLAEERKTVSAEYGLVSAQSIGAIQRALLRLEQEGGNQVFGEPALELSDLMRTTPDGRGVIGILAADQLVLRPRLYSSFLLWLLSELFESLPEVGDLDKPRLVFVFDEAHLLFDDAPPALQRRIEQVVRIIRSKGVGVYFCSQFPDDVPPDIGCSTRCARSPRATRRRCAPRPRPSSPIPTSTWRARSVRSAPARRWCRPCRRRASRCRWSTLWWRRRAAGWARSPRPSVRRCAPQAPWAPSTTRR
jgi:DNA helicase HerA-like ATPase